MLVQFQVIKRKEGQQQENRQEPFVQEFECLTPQDEVAQIDNIPKISCESKSDPNQLRQFLSELSAKNIDEDQNSLLNMACYQSKQDEVQKSPKDAINEYFLEKILLLKQEMNKKIEQYRDSLGQDFQIFSKEFNGILNEVQNKRSTNSQEKIKLEHKIEQLEVQIQRLKKTMTDSNKNNRERLQRWSEFYSFQHHKQLELLSDLRKTIEHFKNTLLRIDEQLRFHQYKDPLKSYQENKQNSKAIITGLQKLIDVQQHRLGKDNQMECLRESILNWQLQSSNTGSYRSTMSMNLTNHKRQLERRNKYSYQYHVVHDEEENESESDNHSIHTISTRK